MAVDLTNIMDLDDFKRAIEEIQAQDGYKPPVAHGVGRATYQDEELLDVWFPAVNLEEHAGSAALLAHTCGHLSGTAMFQLKGLDASRLLKALSPFENDGKSHPNRDAIRMVASADCHRLSGGRTYKPVVVFIDDLDIPPSCAEDVYFRLHLLSHRKVRPHDVNLDGAFGLLNNVAWTDEGPFLAETFDAIRLALGKQIYVRSVDKFPRMTDYVVPSGIRIADADRVRLGAHLAEGTTVMQAGFVNFNAGTLGKAMIEGRISAGVTVGAGSDLGGGSSTMGTLSGGGKEVITIGEGSLIGANGGTGIPLGDNCIIEAGLYITAGTKVIMPDSTVVKARKLAGKPNWLFRRSSTDGMVEAIAREKVGVELNEMLHAN